MPKDVSFQGRPPSGTKATVDRWVGVRTKTEEPMKRLTINVPESLHSRVKLQCVKEKTTIADLIRNFLEQRFPETNE